VRYAQQEALFRDATLPRFRHLEVGIASDLYALIRRSGLKEMQPRPHSGYVPNKFLLEHSDAAQSGWHYYCASSAGRIIGPELPTSTVDGVHYCT